MPTNLFTAGILKTAGSVCFEFAIVFFHLQASQARQVIKHSIRQEWDIVWRKIPVMIVSFLCGFSFH